MGDGKPTKKKEVGSLSTDGEFSKNVDFMADIQGSRGTGRKTLFQKGKQLDVNGDMLSQIQDLVAWSSPDGAPPSPTGGIDPLAVYKDKEAVAQMFTDEARSHREEKKFDIANALDHWGNNFTSALLDAKKHNRLNDFLVSLSASASIETHQWASLNYAEQLAASGEIHKAATYFIQAGESRRAISLLMDRKCFRDAACLAKLRLAKDDVQLYEVFTAWAASMEATGLFESAAKCYFAIGKYPEMVDALGKRKDPDIIFAATKLAVEKRLDAKVTELGERGLFMSLAKCRPHLIDDFARLLKKETWQAISLVQEALMMKLFPELMRIPEAQELIQGEVEKSSMFTIPIKAGKLFIHDVYHAIQSKAPNLDIAKFATDLDAILPKVDSSSVGFAECFSQATLHMTGLVLASARAQNMKAVVHASHVFVAFHNNKDFQGIVRAISRLLRETAPAENASLVQCCPVVNAATALSKSRPVLMTELSLNYEHLLHQADTADKIEQSRGGFAAKTEKCPSCTGGVETFLSDLNAALRNPATQVWAPLLNGGSKSPTPETRPRTPLDVYSEIEDATSEEVKQMQLNMEKMDYGSGHEKGLKEASLKLIDAYARLGSTCDDCKTSLKDIRISFQYTM